MIPIISLALILLVIMIVWAVKEKIKSKDLKKQFDDTEKFY